MGKPQNHIPAVVTLSTFFYIGYLPFIPGTFGSLAGVLLYYLIKESLKLYLLVSLGLLALGFISAGKAEKSLGRKDSPRIVIDEVCGILIALAFIPYDIKLVIIGFFLFRILDTLKPYPAGRLQGLKGSAGIMLDDIIAGLYANVILQIALKAASFKVS